MANFNRSGITTKAINLIGKALKGETIQFTRLVMGDGEFTGEIVDLAGVVSMRQSVDITNVEHKGNICSVSGELATKSVTEEFWWREIGLYALDPQEGEILYSYAYSDKPDCIVPDGSGVTENIIIGMTTAVGENTKVEVIIDDNMVFVDKKSLENKLNMRSVNISDFPRLLNETSDNERILRMFEYCSKNKIFNIHINHDVYLSETLVIKPSRSFYYTIMSDKVSDIPITIKATDDFTGEYLVKTQMDGISFIGLSFDGLDGRVSGIDFEHATPDCDTFVSSCKFVNLKKGINFVGRNFRCYDNTFGHVQYPISLTKHSNGQATYGNDLRGIRIYRNIFHNCSHELAHSDLNEQGQVRAKILQIHSSTLKQSVEFCDNLIEIGNAVLVEGYPNGLICERNCMTNIAIYDYAFNFKAIPSEITAGSTTSTGKKTFIIDNKILDGSYSSEIEQTKNILLAESIYGLIFTGNFIDKATQSIIFSNNVIEDSYISNNIFCSEAYRGGEASIYSTHNLINTYISNNFCKNDSKIFVSARHNYKSVVQNNRLTQNMIEYLNRDEMGSSFNFFKTGDGPDSAYNWVCTDTRPHFNGQYISKEFYSQFDGVTKNVNKYGAHTVRKTGTYYDVEQTKPKIRHYFTFIDGNGEEVIGCSIDDTSIKSNKYLILGNYHFWVDADGKLRMSNGYTSNDKGGTIVGTQA